MIKATDMKKGMVLRIDGNLCTVVDYQHVKLGKGGAVLQTKLKNVLEGNIITKRLRSDENIEDYTEEISYLTKLLSETASIEDFINALPKALNKTKDLST